MMDDLISRNAAIATAVRAAIDWHRLANPQYSIAYCIGEAMRSLPSEQPEIIRCKDCENYQTDWQPLSFDDGHYCAMVDTIMPYDGFCHMGERRTDE